MFPDRRYLAVGASDPSGLRALTPCPYWYPFWCFAIGVSHSVQMVGAVRAEVFKGTASLPAARAGFKKLIVPGTIALVSDTIGFVTILLIKIQIIQEMAITASLGVAVIIFSNLFLLPVLLSYVNFSDNYKQKLVKRVAHLEPLWVFFAKVLQAEKCPCYRSGFHCSVYPGLVEGIRYQNRRSSSGRAGTPRRLPLQYRYRCHY